MFDLARRNNFLSSYNPFYEMEELEKNAFNDFFGSNNLSEFKTDVMDEGDHYVLEADLPGFEKKDIDVQLNGDLLTIKAERHSKVEEKDKDKIVRMERSYGSYSRQFNVDGIDAERISAKYEDGVLTLNLPKLIEVKPEAKHLLIE